MNENFITKVKVEIEYDSVKPQGYEYESHSSQSTVSWNLSLELKNFGVNGTSIKAQDQEISFPIELQPNDHDDVIDSELSLKVTNIETEAESCNLFSAIYPSSIKVTINDIRKVGRNFEGSATAKLVF